MRRVWWIIGGLGLLTLLGGGLWYQGVVSPARPVTPVKMINPADVYTLQFLPGLPATWRAPQASPQGATQHPGNSQEPRGGK